MNCTGKNQGSFEYHREVSCIASNLCVKRATLSNDPDKNCSIFNSSVAICFHHVETVVFSDEEFINPWKAGL